jgi:alpha-tubulin suppressor-like RCC1 family protein
MVFPGQWKTIGGTFATSNAQCIGVKADGSLWAWGNNYGKGLVFPMQGDIYTVVYSPIQWGTEKDWADVHVGGGFYFLVKDDGRIFTFGRNDMAGLPNNSTAPVTLSSPVLLASGARYKQFSAFGYGWAGLKSDGSLWMSGGNGQTSWMGINNMYAYYSSPVQLAGTWSKIQTGTGGNSGHMYAIKSDGTLWVSGTGNTTAGGLGLNHKFEVSSITQLSSNTGWVNLGNPGTGYYGVGVIAIRST